MVFLIMYYMFWGLGYFCMFWPLENYTVQCDIFKTHKSWNVSHQQQVGFLITYSIEIFYFHIYHEDFYGLSNNVLHVLGTKLFL